MGKYRTIFVVGVMAFIANGLYRTPGSPHVDGLITIISICAISGAIVGKITSWALQRQKNSMGIKRPSPRYQRSQVKTSPTTTDAKITTTETSTSDKDCQEYIITTVDTTKVATTKTPTSDTSNKPRTQPKPNIQHQSEFINLHHPLIVLDTSVILKAIDFNNNKDEESKQTYDFLVQNKERIKVPEKAMHEANQILKNWKKRTSEMLEKMKFFEGKVVESDVKAIENVNKTHECDRDDVDSSPIVLNRSELLDAIGYDKDNDDESKQTYDFLVQNKERIKVLEDDKRDVEQMLSSRGERTSEMLKKMTLFEGKEVKSYQNTIKQESYQNEIEKVNKIHGDAVKNKNSEIAKGWIRSKSTDLEKKFKEPSDSESESDLTDKKLRYLDGNAESDRKIMATALVLAKQENVILISNDGDFTAFEDDLFNSARCWLQVGRSKRIPAPEQKSESPISLKVACKYAKADFCICEKECTCTDDLYEDEDWCLDYPSAQDILYAYSHLTPEGINLVLTDLDKQHLDYFNMVVSQQKK